MNLLTVKVYAYKRMLVIEALERTRYNVKASARSLGITRTALYKIISALHIDIRSVVRPTERFNNVPRDARLNA